MTKGDSPIPLDNETREVIRLLQTVAERDKQLILHPPGTTDKSRSWHASQAAARLAQINRQLDQVKAKLVSVTGKKITAAYREGINQAEQHARDVGIRPAGGVIQGGFTAVDRRRATVLIRQTAKRLADAVDSIKATTGKIVKQTQALGLDTRDVNRLLAGGTLDGKPKAALRELKKLVQKAAIDGKIVTVNRNTGKMRSFKPDYYAEMVFQTKLAETTNVATIQRLRDKKILYVKIIGSSSRNFCTAFVGRVFYIGDGNDPKYGFPHIRQLPRGGPPFHPRCTKRFVAFIPALQGEEAIEKARLKPNEQELLNKPSSEAQKVFEASQKNTRSNKTIPPGSTSGDRQRHPDDDRKRAEAIDQATKDTAQFFKTPPKFVDWPDDDPPQPGQVAAYNHQTHEIWINRNISHDEDVTINQKYGYPLGTLLSTGHPLGTYYHELGHAAFREKAGSGMLEYRRINHVRPNMRASIIAEVSEMAAVSEGEFLAEIFAGLMAGRRFGDDVMAYYRGIGGVE